MQRFHGFSGLMVLLVSAGIALGQQAGPNAAVVLAAADLQKKDAESSKQMQRVYQVAEDRNGGPCPILWATPFGFFWGTRAHGRELEQVVAEQLDDREANCYEKDPVYVNRGDVVIDAGAHVGVFTRMALNRGSRRVIAFEPQPSCVACLNKTFAKEIASGRVTVIDKGVWEASGTLEFVGGGLGFRPRAVSDAASRLNASKNGLPVTTIDEAVRSLGLERLDFIKMDIEGSERHALRGARASLAKFGPKIAVVTYHRPDDRQAIPDVVLKALPRYHMIERVKPAGSSAGPSPGGVLYFHLK